MPTNTITPAQHRYNAARRNQATMAQVTALLNKESTQVLSLAQSFDQSQLGGYLRTVVPGLIDRYGQVNAVAAMKYYDEQRLAWMMSHTSGAATKNSQRTAAQRFAAAKLQSQIYVATLPKFDAPAIAEPIIGYGMKRFMDDGFDAMKGQVSASLTRAVGSYHRDTIIYNAGLDSSVVRVQRVAEPNACEFCRLVAFQSYRGSDVRTADYAIHYHDSCHCSIETIYEGDSSVRPPYYDDFEQQYIEASRTESGTKDILRKMRELAK